MHACLSVCLLSVYVRVFFYGGKRRKRAHFVKAEIDTTCTKEKQDGEYVPTRRRVAEILPDTARAVAYFCTF